MNLVMHTLAGGAIAHSAFISSSRAPQSTALILGCTALASVASHGALDWLRHGYPIPSVLDAALALALVGIWLLLVRKPCRPLFAVAFGAAFLPDLLDHLPRLVHLAWPLPHPIFPWHSPTWSGSLYPASQIRPGSHLVALEAGNNALISQLNHALVIAVSLVGVSLGRSAFAWVENKCVVREHGLKQTGLARMREK